MSTDRKVFLVAALIAAAVFGWILFFPQAAERLAPELERAWVAIEAPGSGVARVGPVEIPAGQPFKVHAVLEATGRDGAVYYTEAPALAFGDRQVEAQRLRRWDRRQEVKVLWQTVEGAAPYIKLEASGDLERFRMTDLLRLDWPQAWTIPGNIDPANDDALEPPEGDRVPRFGTQRYRARIELYDSDRQMVPSARFTSWGAEELMEHLDEFPTVSVVEEGPLRWPTAFFGLTHIDTAELEDPPHGRLAELTRDRLAFEPVPLLAFLLEKAGSSVDELRWRRVDLDSGPSWDGGGAADGTVAAGDLLQVAGRWVVLFRDVGRPGVLDREDLCLDFGAGAAIRPLGEVFTGSGGDVEVARP